MNTSTPTPATVVRPDYDTLDAFTKGYVTCALWSSNDNADDQGGESLDTNHDHSDIDDETLAAMVADCNAFREANAADLETYYATAQSGEFQFDAREYAGHDLFLSRNGHGAGYFDREGVPDDVQNRLQEACGWQTAFPEIDLYVADDGTISAE